MLWKKTNRTRQNNRRVTRLHKTWVTQAYLVNILNKCGICLYSQASLHRHFDRNPAETIQNLHSIPLCSCVWLRHDHWGRAGEHNWMMDSNPSFSAESNQPRDSASSNAHCAWHERILNEGLFMYVMVGSLMITASRSSKVLSHLVGHCVLIWGSKTFSRMLRSNALHKKQILCLSYAISMSFSRNIPLRAWSMDSQTVCLIVSCHETNISFLERGNKCAATTLSLWSPWVSSSTPVTMHFTLSPCL